MEEIVQYIAVDTNGEMHRLPEGTKVTTKEQRDGYRYKKELARKVKSSGLPFVFLAQKAIERLEELSLKDLGYLLILVSYVDYVGMIKPTKDSTNPMTKGQMKDALKIGSDKTLNSLLQRLTEKGILYSSNVKTFKKDRTAYFISTEYAFKKSLDGPTSKLSTVDTVRMFVENVQEVFYDEEQDVKPAQIGFIYRVLKYIHYESNLLVLNPDEHELLKIERITVSSLADMLGMTIPKTSNYLKKTTWKGYSVFSRIKLGSEPDTMIKVNPFLFYRGVGEPKAIGAEFLISKKR